jgi:hypothetical protein
MSFREKRAWIELVSVLGVYGVYVALFGRTWAQSNPADVGVLTIGAVVATTVVLVVLLTVLTTIAAATSPKDAMAPYDERDRMIDHAASTAGFYALQAGAFMILVDIVLHASPALIANSALLAMAAGQAVRAGWQVVGYRRGAA